MWFHHVPPPFTPWLGSDSTQTQVNAFRAGLNDVFPFNALKAGEQVLGESDFVS
jgi:hypothetical protein